MWECGDEVATRRCVPGALGRLVEVWYASWLLVASLGDGVLTWMPCGSHNREVSGALRAVMVPVVACGGLSVRYGIVPGDGLRRLLCYHVDCSDGRLA